MDNSTICICLALSGEIGAINNLVKDHLFYNRDVSPEVLREHIKGAYEQLAALCENLGLDPETFVIDPAPVPKAVYKPKEFAGLLGVSTKTLQRWDKDGRLKASRTPTNRCYYTREDYLQYKEHLG